jgi:hypothetical protein
MVEIKNWKNNRNVVNITELIYVLLYEVELWIKDYYYDSMYTKLQDFKINYNIRNITLLRFSTYNQNSCFTLKIFIPNSSITCLEIARTFSVIIWKLYPPNMSPPQHHLMLPCNSLKIVTLTRGNNNYVT